ncbi:uncharacterized protein LOC128394242 isoform X3 [Panonychus citri]|uniref:uncharacterized protein LOC128394242 isoform X3 n=1 Tax=Panonychus citri TaxID=50023 RepID=UPI0023072A08|nr:uncharacterized protein LOC128394242 isoform X3 [Panonychus citri]
MNINDLPDDCLILIFEQFFDLKQFPTLSKICSRWRILVQERLKKVTHLKYVSKLSELQTGWKNYTGKYVLTNKATFLERIKLSQVLPNVYSINLQNGSSGILANLLGTGNSICILFINNELNSQFIIDKNQLDEKIIPHLESVEKLATNNDQLVKKYLKNHGHLKRLKKFGYRLIPVNMMHVISFAASLINLELLYVVCDRTFEKGWIENYIGPKFEKLESLYYRSKSSTCYATKFVDFCPNLRNFHLTFKNIIPMDECVKHYNLEKLSILIQRAREVNIIYLARKFPNIRHLIITGAVTQSDLIEMIKLLPHLSNLSLSGCLTHHCKITALNEYFLSQNRKIDLKINRIDYKI